jgi:hypothetical protein
MTKAGGLDRFLAPDPGDVGCGEALQMLAVYVDLMVAGGDPEGRFPGIAGHLRDWHPCRQDLQGLAAAARRG